MHNSPEKELEVFLAALPARKRKMLELGLASLTPDELNEIIMEPSETQIRDNPRPEYERLLRRIPAKWREYRARELAQLKASFLPKNPDGRPRKDALADEAERLQKEGLSHALISIRLNKEYGEATTKDSIRGLLKSRRRESRRTAPPPEKT